MASASEPLSIQRVPSRPAGLWRNIRRNALAYALLFPLVFLLIAFLLVPFVSLFYYSLQRTDVGIGNTFVGIKNFEVLLREDHFRQNIEATLIYLGGVLVI